MIAIGITFAATFGISINFRNDDDFTITISSPVGADVSDFAATAVGFVVIRVDNTAFIANSENLTRACIDN